MFVIRVVILLIFPLLFSCTGGSSSLWKPYVFDGANFLPTADNYSKAIWLRNGHSPATSEPSARSASSKRLPPGTGAVAGICFIQTSGGKISSHNSFSPYPDEQITFKSKTDTVAVTRTDNDGYFTGLLPAGNYELFCRGALTDFTIKNGETTLVPIRGGKRMAD